MRGAADGTGVSVTAGERVPSGDERRVLRLRYDGRCVDCGEALPRGETAEWHRGTQTVTCLACAAARPARDEAVVAIDEEPPAPPLAELGGVASAGASAAREFERRHARRERRIDERWGRLAPVVKAVTDDPRSTTAWAKGSDGERRLAAHLGRVLEGRAVLLHDRRQPGRSANIDHIAVAPSGVWVIDAKNYRGRVERRDVGGWFRTDVRLYVGGRDRTRLVEGLERQIEAIKRALAPDVFEVHAALCFTDATWGVVAKPFQVGVAWVTWANALAELISAPGPIGQAGVESAGRRLGAALPPA